MLYSFFAGNLSGIIQLSAEESHHLISVRRGREGEPVTLLDGCGHIAAGRIAMADIRHAEVTIETVRTVERAGPSLCLAQAMPLGKTMETIVQKAAELGVARIVPLCTERSELRLDAERTERKLDKWRQAAIEAVKQCGNPFLPQIDAPLSIARMLDAGLPKTRLVCSLEDGSAPLLQAVANADAKDGLVVAIGPEGDFTPGEYKALRDGGFLPVSLGPLVLRSDTAAVVSLAVASAALRK